MSKIEVFVVQRTDGESVWATIMNPTELIMYIDMADCHNEQYVIYDGSNFGKMEELHYTGWQPDCVIEVADKDGNIVLSGLGTDH